MRESSIHQSLSIFKYWNIQMCLTTLQFQQFFNIKKEISYGFSSECRSPRRQVTSFVFWLALFVLYVCGMWTYCQRWIKTIVPLHLLKNKMMRVTEESSSRGPRLGVVPSNHFSFSNHGSTPQVLRIGHSIMFSRRPHRWRGSLDLG